MGELCLPHDQQLPTRLTNAVVEDLVKVIHDGEIKHRLRQGRLRYVDAARIVTFIAGIDVEPGTLRRHRDCIHKYVDTTPHDAASTGEDAEITTFHITSLPSILSRFNNLTMILEDSQHVLRRAAPGPALK